MNSIIFLFVLPLIPLAISFTFPKLSYYFGVISTATLAAISLVDLSGYLSFSTLTFHYFSIGFHGLSVIFEFIVAVTELIVYVFSIYYMPEDRRLAFFISIAVFTVNSVIISRNVILFLMFWESMSISGYLLIGYKNRIKSYPPFVFFAFGELSTVFLTIGFAAYFFATGSLQIGAFVSNPYITLIILLGFIFKMGIVPLQMVEWLPIAHGNAPTSGSILFSASMTTVALYGMLVFATSSAPDIILGVLLIVFGSFSLLFGSIFAVSSENSKMLPAYSTVENSGAMIMMVGLFISWRLYDNLPLYSFILLGILIYATAHAWSKSTAFVISGISLDPDINSRRGIRIGKFSKFSAAVAAISLMGLLPLGGGIGEWFLLESLFISASSNQHVLLAVVAILSGSLASLGAGISIPTFTKYFSFMTGKSVDEGGKRRIGVPLSIGGTMVLGISLFIPFLVYVYSVSVSQITLNKHSLIFLSSLKGIPYPFLIYSVSQTTATFGFISPLFIMMFIATAALATFSIGGRQRRSIPVWNGGIDQEDEMSSFAYANVLRIILSKVYLSREEKTGGEYHERTFDIFWIMIVDFALIIRKFSSRFGKVVMNGSINRYIAYIIVAFLSVLIIVSF